MLESPLQSEFSRIRRSVVWQWPVEKWKSASTIAAVSGGPDSVAMLRVLHSLFAEFAPKNKLVVAHINHKTQLQYSDRDADFVKQLAGQLGLACHIVELTPGDDDKRPSEQTLREARYQSLKQLATTSGARYVATAHNRDDQIETILFRIFRGTGIPGLTGIPRFRPVNERLTIVRPLLDHSRAEILEMLVELGQDHCVDATNATADYSRNFLRNEVIPKIKERFGATFEKGVLSLGRQARENQMLLDELCSAFASSFQTCANRIVIDRKAIAGQSPVLVRHALVRAWRQQAWPLQNMTTAHWSRLADFVCAAAGSSSFELPGNVRVELTDDQVVLGRTSEPAPMTDQPRLPG